ncbi:MAG: hypothetical protein IT260_03220, partial [Saprospiraceae bacterium]|nr:hypothetical protein [Saprospiraceae bacterium]
SAQVQWRGGFPGRETDWSCARNWTNNRVPDNLDQVTIPDCSTRGHFYPVISHLAEVQSLEIHSNARLTIAPKAQLTVMGFGLPGGALFNQGVLYNEGTLQVIEPVMHALEVSGRGTVIHSRSELVPDICEVECDL